MNTRWGQLEGIVRGTQFMKFRLVFRITPRIDSHAMRPVASKSPGLGPSPEDDPNSELIDRRLIFTAC